MAETLPVGDSDEVESIGDEQRDNEAARKILNFPEVLAALQGHRFTEIMANLPESVKRRIKALKKIQLEHTHIEAKFFEEVHALECKYHELYMPLYEKRNKILTGAHEPTDEEANWVSDEEEEEEELNKELKNKAVISDGKKDNDVKDDAKGIPEFWLTIFKNVELLSEMVHEHDEPILKHLTDIKVRFIQEPMGFVLEFHFEPNEYFTDTVLTKEYDMKSVPEEADPFGFEGPEIYKCRGCVINWNKGKNVTLKTVKKKQKHKSRGLVRTITKTVQNDSFFNFFAPPTIPDDQSGEEVDDELRSLLTADFEIGHYIRERIVPRAVLYFTGEAIDAEEMDEEEEEEEDDDEEEEESGDEEVVKQKVPKGQAPDCKQQ